ncbi:MAG: o-succinylbenzoate synthase [Candidatus Nanopelagicales bacterium]
MTAFESTARALTAKVGVGEVLADAVPFRVELKVPFRGVTHREGLLLQGPSGWGEFAPFTEYDDLTASRWLLGGVEAAFGQWPDPVRQEVRVNAIIPALTPEAAASLAVRAFESNGATTFKIKVGGEGNSLDDDCARVAAVREAVDSAIAAAHDPSAGKVRPARIRVDANGAWTYEEALQAIPELDDAAKGMEYVEQPCMDLGDLAQVRRNSVAMVAADESIRTADDPVRIANGSIADILVLKVPPLGGVTAAYEVIEAARVPVVISGAMDTSVGLSAGLALAGVVENLPFACGLGTGELLATDVVTSPVVPRGGVLPVERHNPDAEALELAQAAIAPERADWWRERLRRAWELLPN